MTRANTEPFSDIRRWLSVNHLDQVDCRSGGSLFGLDYEGGFALFAVALRKAIRRQPTHRGTCANVDTPAVLGGGKPFILKYLQGVTDGHSGNAVVLHQLSFGRQLLAWLDPALRYRLSQVIGDLAEDGTVASSIDALRQHVDASHSDS